jgi:acyl carrier protein
MAKKGTGDRMDSTMLETKIVDMVVEYIEAEHRIDDVVDIRSLRFIDEGYVSSLGLIQIVVLLEDEFNIEFTDQELESESFRTIGGLAELIADKLETASNIDNGIQV